MSDEPEPDTKPMPEILAHIEGLKDQKIPAGAKIARLFHRVYQGLRNLDARMPDDVVERQRRLASNVTTHNSEISELEKRVDQLEDTIESSIGVFEDYEPSVDSAAEEEVTAEIPDPDLSIRKIDELIHAALDEEKIEMLSGHPDEGYVGVVYDGWRFQVHRDLSVHIVPMGTYKGATDYCELGVEVEEKLCDEYRRQFFDRIEKEWKENGEVEVGVDPAAEEGDRDATMLHIDPLPKHAQDCLLEFVSAFQEGSTSAAATRLRALAHWLKDNDEKWQCDE